MAGEPKIPADILDLLAVGVWIAKAPSGKLVLSNKVFREIMGMDARSDVAAGGYTEPYGIRDAQGAAYPEDKLPFSRALRERTIVKVDDIVIHRPDGTRVDVRATARPWIGESGEVELVVISFEDITAEAQAYRARAASEEQLRQGERLRSLGQLATGVAHDFNNILTSISIIAEDIRARDPASPFGPELAEIGAAVTSASQLTKALLAFGRAGSGKATRFDLASAVRSVLDLTKRTFDRNIEVTFAVRGSGIVRGDPSQIEQLCLNLLINARDAMTPDGGRLAVTVEDVHLEAPPIPLAPGQHVVLTVADTGPGVPPEIRDRIFEPYFTTKGEGRPGTGLGLATVHAAVRAFGGRLEVLDNRPRGAAFRVTLPVARSSVTSMPATRQPETAGRSLKILVVDDERMVRDATRRSLEQLGHVVLEARDGQEAIDRVVSEQKKIDLVLLDVVMPKLNGRDALARLRRLAPDVPVILTSGHLDPSDEETVIGEGARSLLAKPFTVRQLSEAVAQATTAVP